jgi:pimeloyl-ACP methyl ester carboxylesterase
LSSAAEGRTNRFGSIRAWVGRFWIFALGFVAGIAIWVPSRRYVAATELLVDLSRPALPPKAASAPSVVDLTVEYAGGSARAHLYLSPVSPHRCLVIGHGVHYKGIEEPRLVRFSSELANAGAVVLTPELSDLADYRVTRSGAEVLGESVRVLSRRCPAGSKVGLLGFSFAGGLALLAALDAGVSERLAYVASVGGYHDLQRVLGFLLTDTVQTLEGPAERRAHEYGFVVLLYEYLPSFVPEEDLPYMRQAIRSWLEEDRSRAWAFASRATTERSEQVFTAVATRETRSIREVMGHVLSAEADTLRALSPAGRLNEIHVPVYLLHGTGDSVIPPEETAWADKELGKRPHRALITPLIEHVELDAHFRIRDALDLVDFMAALI